MLYFGSNAVSYMRLIGALDFRREGRAQTLTQ
jgi:hypothetical protein